MIGSDRPVRVFIVDDEPLARQDVAMLLARLGQDFVACGEAADGQAALEAIPRTRADIVVLDITMPVLDGRVVMRELRTAGSQARIIVLSGYAEFEYAREAIAAGAVDYLLKPIDDAAFTRVMRTAAASVRAERARERALTAAPAAWLARMAHGTGSAGVAAADAREAAAFLTSRPWYAVVAVHVSAPLHDRAAALVARWFGGAPAFASAGSRAESGDWLVLVAAATPAELEAALAGAAESALAGIEDDALGSGVPAAVGAGLPSLGVSIARSDPDRIPESSREAREALKHRLAVGPGRLFRFGETRVAEGDSAMGIIQAGVEAIRGRIRDLAADAAAGPKRFRSLLEGIFTADLVEHAGYDQLRRAYAEIVHLVLDAGAAPLAPAPRAAVLSGDAIDEAESVREIVETLCRLLTERLGEPLAVDGRRLAAEARRLVDERFYEPLSLKGVADRLGLNPTYLSELFKREAGANFGAYLTMVRTEAAKRLLARTDLPVREVATAVGYAYPEYFQRVFRRREGVTPEVWRRASATGTGAEGSSLPS